MHKVFCTVSCNCSPDVGAAGPSLLTPATPVAFPEMVTFRLALLSVVSLSSSSSGSASESSSTFRVKSEIKFS